MIVNSSDNYYEIECALILSRLPGVGAATFKKLLLEYKLPSKALSAYEVKAKNKKTTLDAQKTVSFLKNNPAINMLWPNLKNYPKTLAKITEPPPVLFTSGDTKILNSKKLKVAIVGARKTSQKGLELAEQITTYYCKKGAILISGLAEGIDTCVHATAIEQKNKTIAVIATGIDVCYPKSNLDLFEIIQQKGLLCTEFFPNTQPHASFFPTRNRIIAALADIIIMVEGQKNSGALYTIKHGIKFGKKVYACNPNTPKLLTDGLNQAIKYGAEIFESKVFSRSDSIILN